MGVRKTIAVANMLVINNKKQVLLLQRSKNLNNSGKWGMPGGLIDKGENPMQASIRELGEETSILPHEVAMLEVTERLEHNEAEDVFITTAVCTLLAHKEIVLNDYEHVAYKWMTIDDLPSHELMTGVSELIISTLEVRN